MKSDSVQVDTHQFCQETPAIRSLPRVAPFVNRTLVSLMICAAPRRRDDPAPDGRLPCRPLEPRLPPRECAAISPPRIEIATALANCSVRSASRFTLNAFALARRGRPAGSRRRTRPPRARAPAACGGRNRERRAAQGRWNASLDGALIGDHRRQNRRPASRHRITTSALSLGRQHVAGPSGDFSEGDRGWCARSILAGRA